MKSIKSMLLTVALLFSFGQAQSASTQIGICNTSDVKVSDGGSGIVATSCINYNGLPSNYSTQINAEFFGDPAPSNIWTQLVNVTDYSYVKNKNTEVDNWSLNQAISGSLVIVLKAGNYYAAYLFDSLALINNGTYSESGVTIQGDSYKDLTLLDIYLSEVPLPAALWLFGPVLLGFIGYRKKIS